MNIGVHIPFWIMFFSAYMHSSGIDRSFNFLRNLLGFLGSSVVKNPPAKAGDRGLTPGLGRSHMPWSNQTQELQPLSLCSRVCKLQIQSQHATTTEARAP